MRISDGAFKLILFIMIVMIAVAIVSLILNGPARAHSWYSQYCCSGQDCVRIPESSVKITKNGYEIRLTPAEHPSLNTPFNYTVPAAKAQMSEDNEYHACIIPSDPDTLRCLYVPSMGY